MTNAEAVRLTRAHIESRFPKTCTKCGRRFDSLADYLRETSHIGEPISYDAEEQDWAPARPMGTFSLANCRCGTTIAISSAGMASSTLMRLMVWLRVESFRRGVSTRQLLSWLRAEIDQQVLADAGVTLAMCGSAE